MRDALLARESALRGYAESGREGFLQPYDEATAALAAAADRSRTFATRTTPKSAADRRAGAARRALGGNRQRHDHQGQERPPGERGVVGCPYRCDRAVRDRQRGSSRRSRRKRAAHRCDQAGCRADRPAEPAFAAAGSLLSQCAARRDAPSARPGRLPRLAARVRPDNADDRDENEAYALVKRHLERSLAGSEIVVLNRNNSQDRLEATTPVEAGGPGGAEARRLLARLVPRRPARPDPRAGAGNEPLLTCELCAEHGRTTCVPSLVGGEVIGSVLVGTNTLAAGQRRIDESVSQAAPVLANLRNLAIAEARAPTDGLTGLPNARAIHDNLKRMVAQAARLGAAGLGDSLRPRPLQADQRRLRPREGRRGARGRERRAAVNAPRERPRRPLRRRGVHDPAARYDARGRGRGRGEAPRSGSPRRVPASTVDHGELRRRVVPR